jgi:hypothetical protein
MSHCRQLRDDIEIQLQAGEPGSVVDVHFRGGNAAHWLFESRRRKNGTEIVFHIVEGDDEGHAFLAGQRGLDIGQIAIVKTRQTPTSSDKGQSSTDTFTNSCTARKRTLKLSHLHLKRPKNLAKSKEKRGRHNAHAIIKKNAIFFWNGET